ncbi:MAG: serine/threonine protein kinase [Candidatus Melainabacteria bacterium]|jgi:serine/threonine protein kinase|nr:serine/threonine protein kinase [Candidatus Melainabacteria bacterium]
MTAENLKLKSPELIEFPELVASPEVSEEVKPAEATAPDFDRPDLDDRFELLEPIGEGAMAYVWKVRDKSIDQILALKLLRKELTQDPEAVSRFQQEARLTMQLEHPHIAAVYEPGNDKNGRPYILMDFVPGETLQQLLAREGKLTEERALGIFEQICQALSYAHMHGIVHRDIKPSNIMIDSTESGADFVKVVDFGIARSIHEEVHNTQALTRPLGDFATPRYMSPEQCLGQEITPQSDIYSLGCVLYEMISGAPPFTETNQVRLILQHLNAMPDYSKFSSDLEQFLSLMLAKDAAFRAPSIDVFRNINPEAATSTRYHPDQQRVTSNVIALVILTASLPLSGYGTHNLSALIIFLAVLYAGHFIMSLQQSLSFNTKIATTSLSMLLGVCSGIAIETLVFDARMGWLGIPLAYMTCLFFTNLDLTTPMARVMAKAVHLMQLRTIDKTEKYLKLSTKLMKSIVACSILLSAITPIILFKYFPVIYYGSAAFGGLFGPMAIVCYIQFALIAASYAYFSNTTGKSRSFNVLSCALVAALSIVLCEFWIVTIAPTILKQHPQLLTIEQRLEAAVRLYYYNSLSDQYALVADMTKINPAIASASDRSRALTAWFSLAKCARYKHDLTDYQFNFDQCIKILDDGKPIAEWDPKLAGKSKIKQRPHILLELTQSALELGDKIRFLEGMIFLEALPPEEMKQVEDSMDYLRRHHRLLKT